MRYICCFSMCSEERNLLVFDLNALVGGQPPVHSLKLFVRVIVNHEEQNKRSSRLLRSRSSSNSTTTTSARNKKGRRKGKRRRWRKQSKIRVFLSDSKGKRKRRLAELRKEINDTTMLKLVLPVSLISRLSRKDTDNKLYLRLQCKRCSRSTQFLLRGQDTSKRCAVRKKKKQNAKKRQKKRLRKRPRKLRRKTRLWRNCEDKPKTFRPTFIYRYS
ncbi:hypothetical protein ElyMa_002004800 [Elysia marginata]|uniref:Uncharacterized protein n=1 Tax=Elysia marginata TaxID=1093978 RepID=A0AAV4F4C3_9GAST|nr:hypothetical protein ElyMa_002004800 [Elysia marginata]